MTAFADNAADAKKVLDKAVATINASQGIQANFLLSGERMGRTTGTIKLKDNKFTAETDAAIVWFNGTTQWTYIKRNDEVNISTPTADQQIQMNPLTFMNLYKSGYKLSMKTTGNSYEVRLVAEDTKNPIQEVYVVLDTNTYIPSQVRMRRKAAWITVNISNFTTINAADSSFSFNPSDFPDAEIIDLR